MIGQVGLCDSFDEDDIQELHAELQGMAGPTLRNFQLLEEEQPILSFSCIDIIRGLLDGEGKDVRLVGRGTQAALRAFLYVLLQLGEQRRSYPHLNTLIREQFYKPNIFRQQGRPPASDQSRAMLDKCLQYFQQVGDGVRIEEYLLREPLFEEACLIMLHNSLQEEEGLPLHQLARKFNIDMRFVAPQLSGECLHLGGSHYQLIREGEYYFIAVGEGRDDLSQNRLEQQSIRSGESGLLLLVAPQASDQSTPKFKNSEVKFRKKSHKNSFGGDLQIVQYRDLLHLQTQKLTMNNAKVLSEFFDGNEVESCAEVLQDRMKKHSFQDIIDSEAKGKVEMKVEMKGSTTLTPQQHVDHRRNRKISSSQIIEYHRESRREEKRGKQTLPEEDEKTPCYNSLVVAKDEALPRMRTSLIGQRLQRIEQRQSSQRESHPQEQSEHSEQKEMGADVQSHMKLKDRKYSYFTQQLASNKAKKAREVDSGNYVFRIPKNQHKNSEVILPTNDALTIRKRFQENPLRFSQLGAPSDSSAQDSFLQQQRKQNPQKNLRLTSSLYSYHIHYQPINWHTKEIIYYLQNGHKEVKLVTKYPPPAPPLLAQPLQPLSSRAAMKDSDSFSAKQRPSMTYLSVVNPYELNETSFLKNRIQSMANLDPFEPDKEETHSAVFSTCRSLRNIASPSKISFNYLSPKGVALTNPPLSPQAPTAPYTNTPTHALTTGVLPSPPLQLAQTLQFRQPSMPNLHVRPQTYSGFGFGHR